jgi:hypothetical protein
MVPPGSWWIVWAALAAVSALMALVLPAARMPEPPVAAEAADRAVGTRSILVYPIGYALFGAGYIAYVTFMIAYQEPFPEARDEVDDCHVVWSSSGTAAAFSR